MEVSASLVTDAESLELMQPGEGALYHQRTFPSPEPWARPGAHG